MAEAQHSAKTCSICGAAQPLAAFPAKGAQCRQCRSARVVSANRRRIIVLRKTAEGREQIRRNKRNYQARLVAQGLTVNGAHRKPKRARSDPRPKALKQRQPWHGLGDAEKFRVRYRLDPDFRAKQRERVSIRRFLNPLYGKQWERVGGRWCRAATSSDGTITKDFVLALRRETHCAYCFHPVSWKSRHIDHVWPLAHGGTHSVDNLVMSCASCNRAKGAKLPLRWLIEICSGPRTGVSLRG